jgi:hypothetical protein
MRRMGIYTGIPQMVLGSVWLQTHHVAKLVSFVVKQSGSGTSFPPSTLVFTC